MLLFFLASIFKVKEYTFYILYHIETDFWGKGGPFFSHFVGLELIVNNLLSNDRIIPTMAILPTPNIISTLPVSQCKIVTRNNSQFYLKLCVDISIIFSSISYEKILKKLISWEIGFMKLRTYFSNRTKCKGFTKLLHKNCIFKFLWKSRY